jgi:hypothetical protein
MGAIAVASARYFQGSRDAFLDWPNPKFEARGRVLRQTGLRNCLHLSASVALPPYDALRCGRMMALIALSKPLQDEHERRFGTPYCALTVTASLRNYAVSYSRISRRKLLGAPTSGHVFRKLPPISSRYRYGLECLRHETWAAAEAVARQRVKGAIPSEWKHKRERMLASALGRLGLSIDLLRLNETATYLGALRDTYIDCLRDGTTPPSVTKLSLADICTYWQTHHLANALERVRNRPFEDGVLLSQRAEFPRQLGTKS